MNASKEPVALKLDRFGELAALCTSAKELSFLKGSDELSNCIARACVKDLGVSSAWLYERSADNEPILRATSTINRLGILSLRNLVRGGANPGTGRTHSSFAYSGRASESGQAQ